MASAALTRRALGTAVVILSAFLVSCVVAPADAPADLLILHAKVYSLAWGEPATDGTPAPDAPYSAEGWQPDAEAVAIRDGRIVFVGTTQEALDHQGPGTRVIDAMGATVVPGLVDSHVHVAELGEGLDRVDLTGVATEEEAVAWVVARARSVPAGEWIVGSGWDEGAWASHSPTLDLLTAQVPDHPVLLDSLHGFAVWGNQMALERAGITRDTEVPSGGEMLRDANGDPTGVLLNRATVLLEQAVPATSDRDFRRQLQAGLEVMARDGYVAVHEAGAGSKHMRALESLEDDDLLPVRVYAMLSARDEDLCRSWLTRGPDRTHDDLLTVRAVKAYYDGALGSRGARLLEDYSDRAGHRGVSGDTYGFDDELVAEMVRRGFQVGVHAIGDAGNRESLEFIERVIASAPKAGNGRHRIEHAQVLHPDDIGRFARSGIIASMEPPHAVEDKTWAEERLGADRVRGAYAWRSLRESGARLIFNSDLTGSDHSIFYGLHSAITRQDKELQPAGGWYPEQCMTPEEALRGYTTWAAYAAGWEAETGILAPGRWADLTVMDLDPLQVGVQDPARLLQGRILLTVVAGQVVHDGRADDS